MLPSLMNVEELPTPWQKKVLWSALTAVAVVTIAGTAVGFIWLTSRIFSFLQPILVPFAIAGVLAYLLEPLVSKLVKWGSSRLLAVFFVFSTATIATAGLAIWAGPAVWTQSIALARQVPRYAAYVQKRSLVVSEELHAKYGITLLPPTVPKQPEGPVRPDGVNANSAQKVEPPPDEMPDPALNSAPEEAAFDLQSLFQGDWLQVMVQDAGKHILSLVRNSLGGFLGVLGFLLSLIIVPIYLFYFLIEAPTIASTWTDYLPLRASAFKDEVVSVLNEVNGYLIAFFRGQLVVSTVNGLVTGVSLATVRLDFGLLIGVVLCFLGIIPYFGITACWVVAVVIASIQGTGSWVPHQPFWLFPLVITGIFFVVHWFDSLFITPRIIGESVGLHPITVIFSVFVWSFLLGGLLGAILAVPLTATIKVLLRRYAWERRFRTQSTIAVASDKGVAVSRSKIGRGQNRPITVT